MIFYGPGSDGRWHTVIEGALTWSFPEARAAAARALALRLAKSNHTEAQRAYIYIEGESAREVPMITYGSSSDGKFRMVRDGDLSGAKLFDTLKAAHAFALQAAGGRKTVKTYYSVAEAADASEAPAAPASRVPYADVDRPSKPLISDIRAGKYDDHLSALAKAEAGHRNRKSVQAAIHKRINA